MKLKLLPVLSLLLACWFFLTNSIRHPNNPPIAKTGAPGEATCSTTTDCHSGGTFIGTVSMSGVPDTVVANQTYTITVTNASNAIKAGFEMTCWDSANAMCGTFSAATGVSIGNGVAGKKYARQSSPKTLVNGSTSWSFNWKAPAAASGNQAIFYFVSLCANFNGTKLGDNALQSSKIVTIQSTSAALEPAREALIKFFPTLVQQNMIHIELLEADHGQIKVFDLNGRTVFQKELSRLNEVDVHDLAKGVYTAHVSAGGKIAAKKFVVE